MEFTNNDVLDIILKLEHHGKPIRVADCVRFAVRVFTQNRNNFLLFTERDIIKGEHRDRLAIQDYQMKTLESGVVVYEYSYSLTDRHFKPFEGCPHDHTKRVVTEQYWRNSNYNQVPSNPVNYQSLNYLRNLIEQEVADRENAIIDVKEYLDEQFVNDLRKEIARSNEVDAEINKKINQTKEATDEAIKAVSDKLDAEVKRSNEVDIELFNAIKKAGQNTDDIKQETDGKIEETNNNIVAEADRAKEAEKQLNDAIVAEADRAKAAERELTNNLTDEVSRAKTKESEIDATIAAEVSRAKVVEGALTDGLDAVRDKANQIAADLAAEVSRSNQKDNDHTAAVNAEVTRATAAEKAITDRLDVIEGDKDVVGSIAHSLEDAKHYTDDQIGKANADSNAAISDNATAIANEVSRATAAEKALSDRLDVAETALNGKVDGVKTVADKAAADLAAEVSRATAKEGELSTSIAAEASRAQTKEGELEAALNVVNGDKDTIGSIAHAVEDANHYTDDEIAKLSTATATNLADALKPYATKQEVDGRIEGIIGTAPAALDTLGEIADRLAEDNDAINAINGVLSGKANSADVYTKSEVDAQHTTITTSVNALDGKVDAEINRAKAAEKVNADNLTALSTKVDGVKTTADKAAADLTDEVNRAKGVEAELSTKLNAVEGEVSTINTDLANVKSAMDVVNGDETVIGSIRHGIADSKHYTDDEISKLNAKVDASVTVFATKTEVANVDAKVDALTTKVNSIETVDAYTKAEVDQMIANVDVTEQLADYAKTADVAAAYQPKGDYLVAADIEGKADKSDTYTKAEVDTLGNQLKAIAEARLPIDSFNTWSEGVAMKNATTVIKDENGTVIAEMVIDNSAEDDTIEVYTKAQVDEMFANVPKIVNLTQSEYDALATKAPNTLYIVNG